MQFCNLGLVVNSRLLRENDRIVTVFTRDWGKFEVNFKSVSLAKGKLKALSVPVSWGDYRFYLKKGSNFPVCTGGSTLSVFSGIRSDYDKLCMGFHYCELINRLTPAQQPAPRKYDLLLEALKDLDLNGFGPWSRFAFTLRVLELAGFGFRETATGVDSELWEKLHDADWETVRALPPHREYLAYTDALIRRFFADALNCELNTSAFVN